MIRPADLTMLQGFSTRWRTWHPESMPPVVFQLEKVPASFAVIGVSRVQFQTALSYLNGPSGHQTAEILGLQSGFCLLDARGKDPLNQPVLGLVIVEENSAPNPTV